MAGGGDFNAKVIEEFRANGGKVGGYFAGATLLLLHHSGAKTGADRVNPLAAGCLGPGLGQDAGPRPAKTPARARPRRERYSRGQVARGVR